MDILDVCIKVRNLDFSKKIIKLMNCCVDDVFIEEIQEANTEKELNCVFSEITQSNQIKDIEEVMKVYMKKYTSKRNCKCLPEKTKPEKHNTSRQKES